jgi:hypothetical protein
MHRCLQSDFVLMLARMHAKTCSHKMRMRVRLIRKYANVLNGIDLTKIRIGDTVELTSYQAELLVREGWAVKITRKSGRVLDFQADTPSERTESND